MPSMARSSDAEMSTDRKPKSVPYRFPILDLSRITSYNVCYTKLLRLFSYETDKASFEEEAKADGILLATFYEEGDEIPVLTNVAVIGEKGESFEGFKPGNEPEVKVEEKTEEIDESPKVIEFEMEEDTSGKRIRISPLAKNMSYNFV